MASSRRLTPPRDRSRELTWRALLGASLVAPTLYLLAPPPAQAVVRPILALAFAAAVAVATRVLRPAHPLAWWVLAAALAFIALGDFAVEVRPGLSDAAYLTGVPLLSVGAILLGCRRTPGRWAGKAIDAMIVATGVSLLGSVYLMTPHIAAHHDIGVAEHAVLMAYPTFDVFLVTFLTLQLHARRNAALALLRTAGAVLLLVDVGYLVLTTEQLYQPGSPIDAGWVLVCGLVATAAWHPSARDATAEVPDRDRIGRARVVVLGLATLSFPAVLVQASHDPDGVNVAAVTATMTFLFLLVFVRLYLVAAEASRLRERTALAVRQTEFATMAAHELRTPLTTLRGSLATVRLGLDRGLPAEYTAELVTMAQRQTDRLERLCRDLDVVVQSDAGGAAIERQPVAVAEVAHEVVETLGQDASRVSVDVAPHLVAEADAVRLGQVLDNLVRNAVQHAGDSAIAILGEQRADHVVVEVVDGGPGLPAQIAEAPFERFRVRGDGATGGFGIGLWIVHQLVTAMGGEVAYDGSNGGATFRVVLPSGAGRLAFSS